jgi:hypothetical protein
MTTELELQRVIRTLTNVANDISIKEDLEYFSYAQLIQLAFNLEQLADVVRRVAMKRQKRDETRSRRNHPTRRGNF